ncbi:MAG: hypothetical protein IT427_05835 [Pirellulales bacterium]|nr:hypothetical protein [Pirellulales bacterium]
MAKRWGRRAGRLQNPAYMIYPKVLGYRNQAERIIPRLAGAPILEGVS